MDGLSPSTVTAAAMLIRIANPEDRSLHRALEKAEQRVQTLDWLVDGDTLQIASYSTPGAQRHTDGQTCDCNTHRGVCWHRAAWLILCTVAAATQGEVAWAPRVAPEPAAAHDYLGPAFDIFGDVDPRPAPRYGRRGMMGDWELERRRQAAAIIPGGFLIDDDDGNGGMDEEPPPIASGPLYHDQREGAEAHRILADLEAQTDRWFT